MPRHITSLTVDGTQLTRSSAYADDLQIAIADFVLENHFLPIGAGTAGASYDAVLSKDEQRILLTLMREGAEPIPIVFSTKPLRGLMRDYLMMVESYQQAIRDHDTRKIEAVDMGRRGMHNEGAEMLKSMLEGKVDMDFNTARSLFTLVAIMHMK